ncbi:MULTISPECIES: LiaI-LiaF-like domain-containing protein [unclassified Undibacterium]|uniref:LiaI-LiaF-like domain-containing protein n=1 Tax=unclassified Undibacterium TaxID=2630295 RepID=UPI003C2F6070
MSKRQPQAQIFFGVLLLIFGALALIDNLDIFNTRQFFQFWPTVFILIGLLKISRSQQTSGRLIGGAFIAVGTLLTLQHMGIVYFRLRDWWPVLIIIAGLMIIFKDKVNTQTSYLNAADGIQNVHSESNVSAIMSGAKLQNSTQDFRGGELTAVMGGIELDLRNASIQTEATLNVFAMWGGIELKIPNDWTVISQGIPVLGGFEDKTAPPLMREKKLYIQGYAIMGAVEIKN